LHTFSFLLRAFVGRSLAPGSERDMGPSRVERFVL
jgi:hypothetical protein